MPRNAKKKTGPLSNPPTKKAEFETFVFWSSLPSFLRGKTKEELNKMGFHHPQIIELLEIKNLSQFAETFGVDNGTLSDWNKRIMEDDVLYAKTMEWMKMLTPNVNGAFYLKAVKKGDPYSFTMWHKIIHDWVEKKEHQIKTKRKLIILNE